jgi:hypothetical protein
MSLFRYLVWPCTAVKTGFDYQTTTTAGASSARGPF